jgi:hypothetical protein
MDVLGHDHIANDIHSVLAASLFKRLLELPFRAVAVEIRTAAIATERNEMELLGFLETVETPRHGLILKSSGPEFGDVGHGVS